MAHLSREQHHTCTVLASRAAHDKLSSAISRVGSPCPASASGEGLRTRKAKPLWLLIQSDVEGASSCNVPTTTENVRQSLPWMLISCDDMFAADSAAQADQLAESRCTNASKLCEQ